MKYHAIDSYIRQLQRSHGLTLQELSAQLGYKSPTSLARLMQETSTFESLQKFTQRLRSCTSLKLSQEEDSQLYDLVELYDVGGEDYNVMLSLRRLLRGEPLTSAGQLMLQLPDGTSRSFLAHYGAVDIKRMLIVNSEQVPIFHDLSLLLSNNPFKITRILYTDHSALHIVHSLHAAMPILYNRAYNSYSYPLNPDPPATTRGLITSDMMLCEYERNGKPHHELVVFTEPNRGQVLQHSVTLDELRRFFPPQDQLRPVRLVLPENTLLGYNRFCAELEKDCAVYRLKPDIGFDQIPVHLLRRAIADHVERSQLLELKPMGDITRKRQQMLLNQALPIYHVMKRSAMWQFVKTGRTSDHVWCCRSFTMEERLEILLYIRHQLMSKPNIHLYFLKDDSVLRDDEFVLYEGKGLFVVKPGTDYDWQNAHAEIMITQSEFLKVFRRYFAESTLRYRVESAEASAAAFDEMIDYCRHSL